MATQYGESSQKHVESAMRRRKKGTLESGRSGKKVKSREQAIAIGLSEAREKGAKVPARKSSKKGGAKKGGAKKGGAKKASRKSSSRKK